MDERHLTAWLITAGVVTSEQMKGVLEEQLRLKQQGTALDVIGVARRRNVLTDEQVVNVLSLTGYRPPAAEPDAGQKPKRSMTGRFLAAVVDVATGQGKKKKKKKGDDEADGEEKAREEAAREEKPREEKARPDEDAPPARRGMTSRLMAAVVDVATGRRRKKKRKKAEEEAAAAVAAATSEPDGAPARTAEPKRGSSGRLPAATEGSSAKRTSSGRHAALPGSTSAERRVRRSITRRRVASGAGLAVALFALPVGLAVGAVFLRPRGDAAPPPPPTIDLGKLGGGGPQPDQASLHRLLEDLQNGIGRLSSLSGSSAGTSAGRQDELRRMRGVLVRLRQSEEFARRNQAALAEAERRLAAIESGPSATGGAGGGAGGDDPGDAEAQRVELAQVERAWSQITERFERILWLCLARLEEERSPLQRGAEGVRGVDLAQLVRTEARNFQAQGPDGLASLVADAELHPVLGVGGYDALLNEVERFPAGLRSSERWQRWQRIVPRFRELRDLADAYARALRQGEDASQRGDIEAVRRAFGQGQHAQDAWFKAVRDYLALPQVVAAFAQRARDFASGIIVASSDTLPPGSDGDGTRTVAGRNWRERFLALEREHRAANDEARPGVTSELVRLLGETLALARDSFDACAEIVHFYDATDHTRVFREETLQPPLREHHAVYFEGAFARASGPGTLWQLDEWCRTKGYEAWRARLRPFLRLVAAANSREGRAREGVRRRRVETAEAVEEFAGERLGQVEEGLAGVVGWMRRRGYCPDDVRASLDDTIARAIERAGDPVGGAALRAELRAVEHTAPADQLESLAEDYARQLQTVINQIVSRSLQAVERAVGAGEPGLAFDLFTYVLLLDPENDRAHRGLGHVKVDGRWLRRFDAERLRAGFGWDERLGWVRVADRERYDRGEYFDLQTQAWTTLAEANRVHADPQSCWRIVTEHFELRSSADLPKSVEVAARLEAFYLAMFRQYDLFFSTRGAAGAAELIFGVSSMQQRPLIVNFYRDEGQFRQFARPPTSWAAGFYDPGQHASFFYDMGGAYSVTVLQHEVTHQILGESSPSGSDAWLAEGAAVYLEDAFFRDAALTLGDLTDHSRIVAYQNGVRAGGASEHRLRDVLGFRTGADWDSGDISKNYRGAGAVVFFLCNFDGGRYRSDFVEYLRDAYFGRGPRIEDYFGLPVQALDLLMERFYNPNATLQASAGGTTSAEDLAAATEALTRTCAPNDPDLDQVTLAYGLLRDALGGASEREADRARDRAERAVVAMRRKQAQVVERVIDALASRSGVAERYARMLALRAEAVAAIEDTTAYPDANHGASGQANVTARVNALRAVWAPAPDAIPQLDTPDVRRAFEVLDATEPWLAELEVGERQRGVTSAELRARAVRAAGCAELAPTEEDVRKLEYDRRVRAWNAAQTQLPEETRRQVEVLNDYRAMLGRHALALDPRLVEAARKHSAWMEQTGIFDHGENVPGRAQPSDRCRQEGYTDGVGENIAMGYSTPETVHDGWFNSSGHHRNMILRDYYQVGVGRAGTYWTQDFGMGRPQLP